MTTLQVFRAKPNPAGKDKNKFGQATAAQLGGEWIDVKNTGSYTVDLKGVEVNHTAYKPDGQGYWEGITVLSGTLGPGQVIRVHSGSGPEWALDNNDRQGADRHHFTGRGYVWNNDKGDTPALWQTGSGAGSWIDKTHYDPWPAEGAVLIRRNDKLVNG